MKVTLSGRNPAVGIRGELDRLFDSFTHPAFGFPLRKAPGLWSPSLDFSEGEKEYIARLEVPGIAKEDLEVTVDGRLLTISGHRETLNEEKAEDYFWREREAGRFVRTVELPSAVDASKVVATCSDGVMTVRLPKAEPNAKSRIPIK